jgi:WD40 repeat protein
VANADRRCPETAARSWSVRVSALDVLGRHDEARALAKEILAAPAPDEDASAAARAIAGEPPSRAPVPSDSLLSAELAEEALRDKDARMQIDRRVAHLEKETGSSARFWLDSQPRTPLSISRDGALVLVRYNATAAIADARTLLPAVFLESASPIQTAAFSPDARRVAAVHSNKEVAFWDSSTGKLLHALSWDNEAPRDIAYTPDGKRLVVAGGRSSTATARVLDAETGKSLDAFSIPGRRDATAVAISPDAQLVAFGTEDGVVELWSLGPSKRVVALPRDDKRTVLDVVFSPKGDKLAAAFRGSKVMVWETSQGKKLARMDGEASNIDQWSSLVFSAEGERLYGLGSDRLDCVTGEWNMKSFEAVRPAASASRAVDRQAGGPAAVCGFLGVVSVVDVASRAEIKSAPAWSRGFRSLAFGAPRVLAAAVYGENALRLFTPRGARYLSTNFGYGPVATSLDGHFVARSDSHTILVWEVDSDKPPSPLLDLPFFPEDIAFGWDNDHIRASSGGYGDLTVSVSRVSDPGWTPTIIQVTRGLRSLRLSRFGRYGISLEAARILLVDLFTGGARYLDVVSQWAELSPDGRVLFVMMKDRLLRYSTASLQRLGPDAVPPCMGGSFASSFDGSVVVMDCGSGDAHHLVFGGANGGATVRPLNLGRRIAGDRLNSLAMALHGDILAAGYKLDRIDLWRLRDNALLATLRIGPGADGVLVEAPDGRAEVLGRYTNELKERLVCRIGARAYPYEVCAEAVLDQGLLDEALAP